MLGRATANRRNLVYRRVPKFRHTGMAKCVVHALKGLACLRSGKLACLALQAVPSVHGAFAPRTPRSQKQNIFSMGPKLRVPGGTHRWRPRGECWNRDSSIAADMRMRSIYYHICGVGIQTTAETSWQRTQRGVRTRANF